MEKFLLKGEDTYHLAPFKYPWAFTMAENSLSNHWTPKEVGMGMDKLCYEQDLSETERFMFHRVFATLTTADLAIASNLTERLYGLIKAAEVKLYMGRQIAEEALHSISYQHVLEVLGVDQNEMYTMYQKVPEISQWFDWAAEKTRLEGDVLLPMIFQWAIWEGVFFPCGFAAIYSLQRRNLMTKTAEQIQYIHRDETMHIGFGAKLTNEVFLELGYRPEEAEVHRLFEESIHRLDIWAEGCIPDILGYNANLHKEHSRYLANRRLRTLGYSPLFKAENVLPWLDEQASIRKEKNFFESRVTEYQSGAALQFDDTTDMADITAGWDR